MFRDRKDAAEKLAYALEPYRGPGLLVLGIPRGGAETAFYVAKHLNAALSLVITRKLGYPSNPEAAFGAVAEDGSIYLSEGTSRSLDQREILAVVEQEKQEIRRRIQALRRGKPLPAIENRTVILTDDGIATGATVIAAAELCRKKHAARIVVAAPIAGRHMQSMLKKFADDVVILETPDNYFAVSQGYESFYNLTDEEVLAFMDQWNHERSTTAE